MADEYIRKQDAVDALKAQADTMRTWAERYAEQRRGILTAVNIVEDIKPADVVPVVRCKECKFRENDDFCTGRGFPCQLVPDDGFCDKGERKE